jgi:hypothetical protein
VAFGGSVRDAQLIALVLGLASAGCAGDIGDRGGAHVPGAGGASGGAAAAAGGTGAPGIPGAGGASGSGGPVIDDPGAPGQPGACEARLPQRLVLLSDLQHANAVSGALGEAARDPALQLSADTKPFSQKGLVVSTSLVHGRLDQAEYAAASLDDRFTEVTGCPTTGDAACARGFLERFAARSFRRPVATEEVDGLMTVFDVGAQTDYVTGVKLAVQAVLSAPSFTYRSEIGEAGANGVARLTAHELASELSFMLTDGPPDDELHAAAESGALATPDGLTAQVERMLALPAVQESLTLTLMAAWQIGNLFGTTKDPGMFPEYTPALQSSMFRETEAFANAVLWTRAAPVSELLTSRESFVDAALAAIYEVPAMGGGGTELRPVTLPAERAGLLTQASLMTLLSRTDNTSVVARGLFVRGALLCLPKIESPPEALAGQIMALLEADMTERERADVRAMTSPCNGCHAGFDAFGLLLESYDPLGRHRTEIDGEPIDTNTSLPAGLGSFTGMYADAVSFAQAAAASPEFTACLTRNLIAYGTGDDALVAKDCQVGNAVAQLPASPTMSDLVRAATASPALVYRSVEMP